MQNFFTEIAKIIGENQMNMVIKVKDGRMSVAISFPGKDDIKTLFLSGPPEEIDQHFLEKAYQPIEKVIELITNAEEFVASAEKEVKEKKGSTVKKPSTVKMPEKTEMSASVKKKKVKEGLALAKEARSKSLYPEALKLYKDVLEIDPANEEALKKIGELEGILGKSKEEIKTKEKAEEAKTEETVAPIAETKVETVAAEVKDPFNSGSEEAKEEVVSDAGLLPEKNAPKKVEAVEEKATSQDESNDDNF